MPLFRHLYWPTLMVLTGYVQLEPLRVSPVHIYYALF